MNQLEACKFCFPQIKDRIIAEEGSMVAIMDANPVTEGHLLLIPKAHRRDYFELTPEERADLEKLLVRLRAELLKRDPSIVGFNFGANVGEAAGQTVFHAHIHFIPRRLGDTPNPRGGVRGVIPERMNY